MSTLVSRLRSARDRLRTLSSLDQQTIWSEPETDLWRAERFVGRPSFYPVYRWRDVYSYAPIFLLAYKGYLRPNAEVTRVVEHPRFRYYSGWQTIDEEIVRVGGPPEHRPELRSAAAFIEAVARGMVEDMAAVEARSPRRTNVVLVGGKDSLNLLLLPWRNPVIAYSAQPNTPLVERFCAENELGIEVRELQERSGPEVERDEVLANCCRLDMKHTRWTGHLAQIAAEHGGEVVFWKGQLGDTFLTPFWRRYVRRPPPGAPRLRRVRAALSKLSRGLRARLTPAPDVQRIFMQAQWSRGAMWQGAHVSMIRAAAGVLVLSAYHGPAVQRALRRVDLGRAVERDLRDEIGARLLGRPVRYPRDNPSPPPVDDKAAANTPARLFAALAEQSIEVRHE